jgi:hypothetical protein
MRCSSEVLRGGRLEISASSRAADARKTDRLIDPRMAKLPRVAGGPQLLWNLFSCIWLVSYQILPKDNPNNMDGLLQTYRRHCEKDGEDVLAMERFITGICCDQLEEAVRKAKCGIRCGMTPQDVLQYVAFWHECRPIPPVPRCLSAKRRRDKDAGQKEGVSHASKEGNGVC